MKVTKKVLPVILSLIFISGASYYLFSVYQPDIISQVKGAKSGKEKKDYLDTIPLPSESVEIGRNVREGFSQITVSSPKPSEEIQKFFRGVLISKGWQTRGNVENLLSTIYTRDHERIEVSVLSVDDEQGTVFSIAYSD